MSDKKSEVLGNSTSDDTSNNAGENLQVIPVNDNKKKFETNLINKEEAFRVLALGQATGSNVLFVGPPGVGKTALVLDFINGLHPEAETFILETNEGTRPSEVKGNIDLKVLYEEKRYTVDSPIAHANAVVINEIDKASPGLRNVFLGIMNEGKLFNGTQVLDCKYDVFVSTCNKIPEDEIDSPFWDRFLLKFQVPRITTSQLVSYYQQGGRNFSQTIEIRVPTIAEIEAINLPIEKVRSFFAVAYKELSDRSLTSVPTLAKAISIIWECSIDKALVQCANLLVGSAAAQELRQSLQPRVLREITNNLTVIGKLMGDRLIQKLDELTVQMKTALDQKEITQEQYDELKVDIVKAIENHSHYEGELTDDAPEDSSSATVI